MSPAACQRLCRQKRMNLAEKDVGGGVSNGQLGEVDAPRTGQCTGSTWPLETRESGAVGRYVVATRPIRPLETVLKDWPALVAPSSRPTCLVCLKKPARNTRCQGPCSLPMCSPECASTHAESYPIECRILGRLEEERSDLANPRLDNAEEVESWERWTTTPSILYSSVGVIRYLDLLRGVGRHARKIELSRLTSLMDHASDLRADKEVGPHLQKMTAMLLDRGRLGDEGISDATPACVENAFGVLRINGFGYSASCGGEGRALYPEIALCSHSCQPNVQQVQDVSDGSVSLVAQRDIAAGEDITLCYTNPFHGSISRRRVLRAQWFFDCLCARCNDPTEGGTDANAIACPKCRESGDFGGFLRPVDPIDFGVFRSPFGAEVWRCDRCDAAVSATEAEEAEQTANDLWNSKDRGSLSEVEECVAHVSTRLLSPSHHFAMKLKSHLVMLYDVRENDVSTADRATLDRRLRLCEEVIKYLLKVDPGQTKKMGVFMLEYNKPKLHLARLDLAEKRIGRIEFLREMRRGANLRSRAMAMIGTYSTVSAHAFKNMLLRKKKEEEEGGDGSDREIDGGSEDLAVVDTGGFVAPEEKPLVDGGED